MKEEILDIAKKLYHNHLTPETATNLLLDLFDVSGRSEQLPCEHRSYSAGHSPFVPCICNDCGKEL